MTVGTQTLVSMVPLEAVRPSPDNVRDDLGDLSELMQSIRSVGILQALVLSPAEDGTYEVICGHRRRAAALLAGLTEVPAQIRGFSPEEKLQVMLIENMHRRPLNPVEHAKALKRMTEEYGWSQQRLAEEIGKSQTHVSNHLRVLELPEDVQAKVAEGTLGVQTALRPFRQPRENRRRFFPDEDSKGSISITITLDSVVARGTDFTAQRKRKSFDAFVEDSLDEVVDWESFYSQPV